MNREIRSYVLRQGRTTPAQKRALEELFPKYGIAFSNKPLSQEEIFHRKTSLVLEIGSGMGETTAEIAKAHPEADFIAVEVHGPGVGSLLYQAVNVRDTPLTTGVVVVYTTLFIALNVLIDVFYFVIDPRIGAAGGVRH